MRARFKWRIVKLYFRLDVCVLFFVFRLCVLVFSFLGFILIHRHIFCRALLFPPLTFWISFIERCSCAMYIIAICFLFFMCTLEPFNAILFGHPVNLKWYFFVACHLGAFERRHTILNIILMIFRQRKMTHEHYNKVNEPMNQRKKNEHWRQEKKHIHHTVHCNTPHRTEEEEAKKVLNI